MKKTAIISYPRSGHHLLVNILKHYWGSEMKYSERYQFPYDSSIHNAVKSHDFNLDEEWEDHVKVVLIRHPACSIWSYLKTEKGFRKVESFEEFYTFAAKYWKYFVSKWADEADVLLSYELLIHSPVHYVQNIIEAQSENLKEVDLQKIRESVGSVGIHKGRLETNPFPQEIARDCMPT